MTLLGFLFSVFLFFLFSTGNAQVTFISGITHGAEFEFTNDWIYGADSPEKVGKLRGREKTSAKNMAFIVRKKCQILGCEVKAIPNGKWGTEYLVTTKSGWWFQISYDPLCVEIQTKPATIQELYAVQPLMEDLIFDSARLAGLEAKPIRSTHINTGARSAFGSNLRSLFNFFIDHANHPEFSSGLFRENWNTAPPLRALGNDPSSAILRIQSYIENKVIETIPDLAYVIAEQLHHIHPNSSKFLTVYNQDLNMSKLRWMDEWLDRAMEKRGVRALKSFQEFVLHAELNEYRVKWVKARDGFIPFKKMAAGVFSLETADDFFRNWLAEMNLSLERYRPLIKGAFSERQEKTNQCVLFYQHEAFR